MDLKELRLNKACKECVRLRKSCEGKDTIVPCLAYQSKEQYISEKLKEMRESLKK